MSGWIDRRRSGVLLHITALPGPFCNGVLGREARQFIDGLLAGGFTVWQFLPLGPTHGHDSPYESLSSFAGNPELLDLRACLESGWLDPESLNDCGRPGEHALLRRRAGDRFWRQLADDPVLAEELEAFRQSNRSWLPDFSLFAAIKAATNDLAWWQWPEPLRDRDPEAMHSARQRYDSLIRQTIFEQFLFDRQWQALKAYAGSRHVRLFGDLPIYVAHDSCDVWANRRYFTINRLGLCDQVAGVPPDYFSATGQRWGNPLYHWQRLAADGFGWWIERLRHQLQRMHMLRIDHFRGLESYWTIPGTSKDGMTGEWKKAPGDALLRTLQERLGPLPLVAEDLGTITPEVTALRETFGLPGMKILQFAFSGDAHNPYLPAHHEENSVVYTGTHDNDTTAGWFASVDERTRSHILHELAGASPEDMPWPLIESALASVCRLAMVPMQDLLELGTEARFNTPGTLEHNWCWRLHDIPAAGAACWARSLPLNRLYQRL